MESLLEWLAATAPAQWMQFSRWTYAAVNACHIFGIALLVGTTVPISLRLLGFWSTIPLKPLLRVLTTTAMTGLLLAVTTGFLLFLADPFDYAQKRIFLMKMCLVAVGALHALLVQRSKRLDSDSGHLKFIGGFSLCIWLSVLGLGRLIAFTD